MGVVADDVDRNGDGRNGDASRGERKLAVVHSATA